MTCLAKSPEWHRSEEHTSELQSLTNLVCRLLLEKKTNEGSIALDYLALREGGDFAQPRLAALPPHRLLSPLHHLNHLTIHQLHACFFFLIIRPPPRSPPFPSTTLFR